VRKKTISALLITTLAVALAVTLPLFVIGGASGVSPNDVLMKLNGHVIIQLNGDTVREFDNLITNVGFDAIGGCVSDTPARPGVFDYIGVGSGTTAPDVTDTDLENPIAGGRSQGAYTNLAAAGQWEVKVVFPPGTATGAITESGVFNAAAAGTLLCRQTFAVVNKEAGDTLEITWRFTLTQA